MILLNFRTAMRGAVMIAAAVAAAGGASAAIKLDADSDKGDAAPEIVVKNDAPGWMWYEMVPYENSLLPSGAAHAGGPGAYAMYTFQGSGVDVYGVRSLTVVADKRTHRVGKVKVSIDDKEQAIIDASSAEIDYHAKIFSIHGLSGGNHVIQISPIGGWAVVDSLVITRSSPSEAGSPDLSPAGIVAKGHLVGYWPCEEGSGATLVDKSNHGHDGTFQAGAAWSKDSRVGQGAVSFAQAGGVEIPGPVIDTTKSFTVAAWVKMNDLIGMNGGYQTFVSMDGADQSGFFLQKRGDTGRFAFTMLPKLADSKTQPVAGQWYHIAGVFHAPTNTLAIFVNGALEGTTQISAPAHADGNTVIGRAKYKDSYADFVAGSIDDVRMYDTALLPADIAALYSAGM